MRDAGKTEDQIEHWIPRTIRERRREQEQNYKALQDEVHDLRERLQRLEELADLPNQTTPVKTGESR